MKSYRIRYNLWRIEADSIEEAKKEACDIIGNNPQKFLTVELASDPRPFWKRLLFGP